MRNRSTTLKLVSAIVVLLLPLQSQLGIAMVAGDGMPASLKQQENNILSLELEFSKKHHGSLERAFTFLGWGANGYATGFLVAPGIALTAYHVVSGELSDNKKRLLGFKSHDQLNVKVYVNGCEATVVGFDRAADLALLAVCGSSKRMETPKFQHAPIKDESLLTIARLHGYKVVSRGTLYGSYRFQGQDYWSAKFEMRDGYSGSPVYNQRAEIVGVFSGYDWNQKLAVISPAARAEELLGEYVARQK